MGSSLDLIIRFELFDSTFNIAPGMYFRSHYHKAVALVEAHVISTLVPLCWTVYNQLVTISMTLTRSDGRTTITITTKRAAGTKVLRLYLMTQISDRY